MVKFASIPATTMVVICRLLQPVGQPGRPVSVRVEGTSVTLEWAAPLTDDGHVIVGYVIKFAVVGLGPDVGSVIEKHNVDEVVTTYTFSELQSKTSYMFAVAAKTDVGEGPFSDFSDPVQTNTGHYLSEIKLFIADSCCYLKYG